MSEQRNSDLKSFRDIKSLNELDFSKVELIRGQTPPDIKEKCLKVCKEYLSGNWCQQTLDTIEVRRITGGLLNQLYYCGIVQPNGDKFVPQEVAIRLYGLNIFEDSDKERIRDTMVSLLFSENKLGPKIYGLFQEGQVQKYYKHRQFKVDEQKNPKIVENIFQTLAKIHSLKPPVRMNKNWMYELCVKTFEEAFQKFPINDYIKQYNCETLSQQKLKTEIEWIVKAIESAESPVVFAHSDYRSSNLLITEPNDELVVCDFDVTTYCYRGSDFVSLMREWGRNPFDFTQLKDLPLPDSQFEPLIEIYRKECEKIYGKCFVENPINSVEHILREVKIFILFSYLFGTVYCLKNDENDKDFPIERKLIMEISELNFKNYFTIKNILIERKIIDF